MSVTEIGLSARNSPAIFAAAGVGVDVVNVSLAVTPYGGNHGNVSLSMTSGIGATLTFVISPTNPRRVILDLCLNHASVHAGQPDGVSALVFDPCDKAFVDLSRKNHLARCPRFPGL